MPGPLPKYPIQLTPEQEGHLQQRSRCYTAPFAEVQRARMLLLAHQHPTWRNVEIARQVGCCVQTVKRWRQRWHVTDCQHDAPRTGTPRTFSPLNHLDIEGREHFEAALDAFEGTVITVSHDRAFLRSFAERVVEVRDGLVRLFPGGYDDYLERAWQG